MSDYNSRDRKPWKSQSESPSSRERRHKDDSYQQDSDSRKRYRSRSRDHYNRPRKRRSLSPSTGNDERHSRRSREPNRRHRSRSRSPHRRRHDSRSPKPYQQSKIPLPPQDIAFKKNEHPEKVVEKQKPNFGNSGRLAAAANTVQTAGQNVVLKYHEPSEARKPPGKEPWRLYIFKGDEIIETLELYQQSCWLFGREAVVVDCLLEHSSCSKQHAVIQFRYIEKRNEFGDKIGKVKPYIIDLESANGTSINDDPVPPAKYLELRDKDVVKFGHSSREYVIQLPPSR